MFLAIAQGKEPGTEVAETKELADLARSTGVAVGIRGGDERSGFFNPLLVLLFTSAVTFVRSLTVAARIPKTRLVRAARVSKRCGAAARTSP